MDKYIGKMLDNRYEIIELIGSGGMANVYRAKCHRLNRMVAIKILKNDLAQNEEFRRRFNAESQAVAQLSHPNIVSVYDVSRGGDTEYIVMELIDGITLTEPFFSTITLWGLMSRWMMPLLWACSRPLAICMAKCRVSFQLSTPLVSMYCFREIPSISSITM